VGKVKHIVVSGGAGFIGSHVARRLIFESYKVTVLDNLSTGKEENIPQDADFIKIDLGLEESYAYLGNLSCDAVFHLAGQSSGEVSFKDPFYDLKSHVHSTFLLLRWCKENGINRFLYASSMAIYGDPNSLPVDEEHPVQPKTFYSAAKIAAEAYVELYQTMGIQTTIFRFFSIYGCRQNLENRAQGMVSIFLSYMLDKTKIIVKGSKDRFRDFVYIDDLVDALISSYNNPATYGKIYNVASGEKTTVEDLIEGLKVSFGNLEYPVEYKDGTPGDQFGVVGDNKLILEDLKWKPKVALQEGLDRMVNFEKERLNIE
tara:strand:+ start:776 stop:1723 length:948 start_codon:yes stop_codon:yes gene_type:complete